MTTDAEHDLGSLPDWYREIFPAGENDGFFQKMGDHSAVFVERGMNQLVVSFDNLSDAGNQRYDREPWAGKFCSDNGWSHLGVFSQGPTWFRSRPLADLMERLRDEGFFARFDKVVFCGASMGGFGALAFCDVAPGSTVIAFSPQTTLDQNLVPWETRFHKGHGRDWTLPFSDAAKSAQHAGQIYAIYDPLVALDKMHIDRLEKHNLVELKAIGLGHKSAAVIRRMDRLKPIMMEAIQGDLTVPRFKELTEGRKDLYVYRRLVESYLAERNKDKLMYSFRRAFRTRRRAAAAAQPASAEPTPPDPAPTSPPDVPPPQTSPAENLSPEHQPAVETPISRQPSAPGNIWMLQANGPSLRYMCDRWANTAIGYEERDGITLAQTPDMARGIVSMGSGISVKRHAPSPHPWHVVDEDLLGLMPRFSAQSQGDILLMHAAQNKDALCSVVAISEPKPGLLAEEAEAQSDAYQAVLTRTTKASETLSKWGKSLFVDRVSLLLLAGAPGTNQSDADTHYTSVTQSIRTDLAKITGQTSLPHVVVSQSAGTQLDGTSEVILTEGRLDVDHPTLGFVVAGPRYPYPMMDGQPSTLTPEAAAILDEQEVIAVAEVQAGRPWHCPFMRSAILEKQTITVDFSAMSNLVLEDGDHGFDLLGCDNGATINEVRIEGTTAILVCTKPPTGEALRLAYAWGRVKETADGKAANTGGIRDSWSKESLVLPGTSLHRFALAGCIRITT